MPPTSICLGGGSFLPLATERGDSWMFMVSPRYEGLSLKEKQVACLPWSASLRGRRGQRRRLPPEQAAALRRRHLRLEQARQGPQDQRVADDDEEHDGE